MAIASSKGPRGEMIILLCHQIVTKGKETDGCVRALSTYCYGKKEEGVISVRVQTGDKPL